MERQQGQKERSVAWFKLADLIARGEREKALSVFRLLSHSLPDKAYVLQIEGDLLWFMEEQAACCEKYKQAAVLYQKEKRWVDAIAVYEHLHAIRPSAPESLTMLSALYALVDWPERCEERLMGLVKLYQQRVIDAPVLEKALHEFLEIAQAQVHPWFAEWFIALQKKLPVEIMIKIGNSL